MLLLDTLPRHLGMFALASQDSRIVLLVLPFLRSEPASFCKLLQLHYRVQMRDDGGVVRSAEPWLAMG